MGHFQLTGGVIAKTMRDEELPDGPLLQILGIKKISGQGGTERYRLHISDGEYSHTFAMLATQLNHLVYDEEISPNCIIKVNQMVCNTMNNKKIIIILNMEVATPGSEVNTKIGNPVPWNESGDGHQGGGGGGARKESSNANSGTFKPPNRNPSGGASGGSFYGNTNGSSNGGVKKESSNGSGGGYDGGSKLQGQQNKVQNQNASSDVNDANVVPIRDINPYANKVMIRARVTNKGPIKTWSNSRGDGKLFSIDLLDDSGEIRMTGFNQSVDQYYSMIEPNSVYYISKFQVKSANKAFTSIPHDYELNFTPETQVLPYLKDTSDIPSLTFNFLSIGEIENAQPDTTIDVIGVCKSYQPVQTITVRSSGKELIKREVTLVDKTLKEVNLTLWGKQAEDFNDDNSPIIAVKGAKVSDFNGRSLSLLMSSVLQINPDLPEAHSLRGWFDNEGVHQASQSLSSAGRGGAGGPTPWKVISEANEVNSGDMEKPDYFMAKVTLVAIKRENALYQACASGNCNKKVVDLGNGEFRCEKCQVTSQEFKWRLIAHVNFADFTDNFWATCFQETGELVLGKTAAVLGSMQTENPEEFDQVIKDAAFQTFIGKFRGKMDTYNNETRKKIDVLELTKINHAEYSKQLLAEIQETRS